MTGNLQWSLLILALGGCIGSYLNVIIYRWPRDLKAREPLWSFCPKCNATLAWYDNLPLLSYIFLRGRCRHCSTSISLQYPLVEFITALVFLMIFDALFVGRQRLGIGDLASDWPMLLAHWILVAGLVTLAVMDLEAYMVDIRVTWIVAALGLLLHMLWTPDSSVGKEGWIRPGPIQASFVVAGTVGLGLGMLLFGRRGAPEQEENEAEPADAPPAPVEEMTDSDSAPAAVRESTTGPDSTGEPSDEPNEPGVLVRATRPSAALRWIWLLVPLGLLIGYVVAVSLQPYQQPLPKSLSVYADGELLDAPPATWNTGRVRLTAGIVAAFLILTLAASHPHPEEDDDIMEAIQAESSGARRVALWELVSLLPAMGMIILAAVYLSREPEAIRTIYGWMTYEPIPGWGAQPLRGLATGLAGWFIGGAVAWGARIVFTLAFGKEALGMGDVHILAATGAVAGWPVSFLGFFLAAPLALLGLVVIAFRRQARALPYGPWLALGFFVVILFQDRILDPLRHLLIFTGI